MTCSNCGAVFDDGCRFCGACGTPLVPEKKGSHKVPILILVALSVLGIVVYFATGGTLVPDPADLPQMNGSFGDDFYVYDGALSANSFNFLGVSEITVPETVDDETITAIDSYGFVDLYDVTAVYLPDTVTEIGDSAFAACWALRGMDLPPALVSIGDEAFYDCDSLEAIHIPASVEHIGQDAFCECDSLHFIFYDGTIEEWKALYPQDLSAETTVCCANGNFYQAE